MQTLHTLFYDSAEKMAGLKDNSVHLMVTSPPYPMIQMWDSLFSKLSPEIAAALAREDGKRAFELMHGILDPIWKEVHRVLVPGGIACINIGDAVRTLKGNFTLYPNHARILSSLDAAGFHNLPTILWRKQTNAPNKFMGSGMLPPNAYVTLEHEHILVLRKGEKRAFKAGEETERRRESTYFWEERNIWFSDVWMDLKGATQKLCSPDIRKRSAAFRFEVPYRLINMFSIKGDVVLDPFMGTGTTMFAAMASCRNTVGFEVEAGFHPHIQEQVKTLVPFANKFIDDRINAHLSFTKKRIAEKKPFKHINVHYGFPVITKQEARLLLNCPVAVEENGKTGFKVHYSDQPHVTFSNAADGVGLKRSQPEDLTAPPAGGGQMTLF